MAQLNTRIVLRNDSSANWLLNESQVLLKGEVGIEFLADGKVKIKIGDGTKTWEELSYFGGEESHVFETEVLAAGANHLEAIAIKVGTTNLTVGDIAIAKETIVDGKVSYTAYVYDGSKWVMMDGNVNAENVYFKNDLTFTYAFGKYAPDSSGSVNVPAGGLSLKALLENAYSEEVKTGLITSNPTASINGNIKYYEIGSTGTQDITVSLNSDGEYKYGYSSNPTTGNEGDSATTIINDKTTGVVVDTAQVSPYILNFNGTNLTPKTTKGAVFTLAPTAQTKKAEMKAQGTVYHTQGAIPVSNLGKMYPSERIAAGSKSSSNSVRCRWYIPMYQGFTYSDTAITDHANITAAQIKALGAPSASTVGAVNKVEGEKAFGSDVTKIDATKITTATAPKAWRQYFLAIPASYGWEMSGAKDGNNIDCTVRQAADVTISYGSGDTAVDVVYNVYYIHNAADYGTLKITWTLA